MLIIFHSGTEEIQLVHILKFLNSFILSFWFSENKNYFYHSFAFLSSFPPAYSCRFSLFPAHSSRSLSLFLSLSLSVAQVCISNNVYYHYMIQTTTFFNLKSRKKCKDRAFIWNLESIINKYTLARSHGNGYLSLNNSMLQFHRLQHWGGNCFRAHCCYCSFRWITNSIPYSTKTFGGPRNSQLFILLLWYKNVLLAYHDNSFTGFN